MADLLLLSTCGCNHSLPLPRLSYVGLQCMIATFPGHTHLLFVYIPSCFPDNF